MAETQQENGFTRLPNDILEALGRTKLSTNQAKVIFIIIRKTLGWGKDVDHISLSQMNELTAIQRQHISRTLKELKQRKIVTASGKKIGLNPNWREWRELPRPVTVTNSGKGVTANGNKGVPRPVTTKETTKETYNKRNNTHTKSPFVPVAEKILKYFRENYNKDYSIESKGAKYIIERLEVDGRTEEDLWRVINNKQNDPEFSRNWMRPETFFSLKHFDTYFNEDPNDYKDFTDNSTKRRGAGQPMMERGPGYYEETYDIGGDD